ncbi:MAG: hypothetical protein LBE55_05460 [Clostridiales bacterium]|jgi:hypothetical protein|nr:hypothetical protein [Clostridiales bacterium]
MAMVQIQANNNMALFGAPRRPGARGGPQTDLMQLRLQERQREMQMRERENERIKLLTERMAEVKNSDMELNLRQSVLESLANQINQIYQNREKREAMAAEREMMRQKAVLEEKTQMRDEAANNVNEAQDPQEARQAGERDMMKGLVRLAVTQDRISTLRQTRAALTQEAGHISRAIHSENSNYTLVGTGGGEVIIGGQSGVGNPNDYRNTQLAKLNLGIARTDAAINQAVSSMYREGAKAQEGWLAEYQQKADEESE